MKHFFYITFISLLTFSCSRNEDTTSEIIKPSSKEIYIFEYKNYSVQNISAYKGPNGQRTEPNESYLNNYWSTYREPSWKKINLNLKNNSIQLISDTSADLNYSIKIENDSVFIHENNEQNFIGLFNKTEPSFSLKRSLIYIKKMPREDNDALIISQRTIFGITKYEDIFGKYLFNSPSELTIIGDDILWSNIDYYYQHL